MAPTNPAQSTIGGHFSLLVKEHDHAPPGRHALESARAGLYAILKRVQPSRIYLPSYTCPDVEVACLKAGVDVTRYGLGHGMVPDLPDTLALNDLLLLTDYFGLCRPQVEVAIARLPSDRIVVDNAQAYFAPVPAVLATLYSPRKFIPVPDGGFLACGFDVPTDPADEDATLIHLGALAGRAGQPPEASRAAYLAAEARLADISHRAMSETTRHLIRCSDQDGIRGTRQANFDTLARALDGRNRLDWVRGDQTPLVYPLLIDKAEAARRALHQARVFCPRYWPGLTPLTTFEADLIENAVFLPIDHRYGSGDMARIIDILSTASDNP